MEDYTEEGFGIARHQGYVLFVPGTIAGEQAEVLVVKAGKRFGYGKLLRLLRASPERREEDCPLAKRCGGCAFWHLSYLEERRLKENRVRQQLERIGRLSVPVLPLLGAPSLCGYRNKAQFPIRQVAGRPQGGFYAPGSHGLVTGAPCQIQPEQFNRVLEWTLDFMVQNGISAYEEATYTGTVRHLYLRFGEETGELMVCLVVNVQTFPAGKAYAAAVQAAFPAVKTVCVNYNDRNTNVVLSNKTETLLGPGFIEDLLLGKRYRIAPASFYQVNHKQTMVLYEEVRRLAALTGRERVLDLYCGIGTIGLSLADQCRELVGVEIVREAVENAKENARLNGVSNARFFCADATAAAARFAQNDEQFDLVVVDPPRKGCDRAALDALEKIAPKKLIYVSCNPATLARDLALLEERGFQAHSATPVDLFPRTSHVETVVLMSREKD